jgi:bcr-type benzoyl-CoA reductase subunit C
MREILDIFARAAGDSLGYARAWKERTGRPVIGSFPMHFPSELAHAAGALPVIIQEVDEPITDGEAGVFSFYCGFNRSVVDQAMKGRFDFLNAIMFGDHCVQLLGTADVVRWNVPGLNILFNQLISSMNADWAWDEARGAFAQLRKELDELLGTAVSDAALRTSIALFNRNRVLIRRLYELRMNGQLAISGREMQHVVKSSMVMDRADHTALLEKLVVMAETGDAPRARGLPIYLSGHLCQAPKLDLLDMIEECGAIVVADDLYHGYRFIASDVAETGDPLDALSTWYLQRNRKVPCPTRVDTEVSLDAFLIDAVKASGAQGIIVLLVKFCEPHMYHIPEIKEAFDRAGISMLLIETEHDSMPIEAFKTRVETFVEIARRRLAVT